MIPIHMSRNTHLTMYAWLNFLDQQLSLWFVGCLTIKCLTVKAYLNCLKQCRSGLLNISSIVFLKCIMPMNANILQIITRECWFAFSTTGNCVWMTRCLSYNGRYFHFSKHDMNSSYMRIWFFSCVTNAVAGKDPSLIKTTLSGAMVFSSLPIFTNWVGTKALSNMAVVLSALNVGHVTLQMKKCSL